MAQPVLRSSRMTPITSNSSSWVLTFPGVSDIKDGGSNPVESGDLILVQIGRDGTTGTGSITGYTLKANLATGTAARGLTFAKTTAATGSEGDITYSPGASEQGVGRILVFKNCNTGAQADVEVSTGNTGNNSSPAPPASFSPSWGSADVCWIAAAAHDSGLRSITAYPSAFPDNQNSDASGGGNGAGYGGASLFQNGSSTSPSTPGTFTLDASDDWVSWIVAIRGSSKTLVSGRTRTSQRLTGVLKTKVSLRNGLVRVVERLKGALGFASVTQNVAGTLRTAQRLVGTLTQTVFPAGVIRTAYRLTGILATTVALAGQVRATERLTGAVTTTVDLAGTTRHTTRLTGAVTFGATTTNIAGTVRGAHARLKARGRAVAPGGMQSGVVRWRATASYTGTEDITGFGNGSRPIKALLFYNPGGSTANTWNNGTLQGTMGLSDGTTNIVFGAYEQHNVSITNAARGFRTDCAVSALSDTAWLAGKVRWTGTTVTDGVRLTYDEAFAGTHDTIIVGFWDCEAEVQTVTLPTNATAEISVPHAKKTYDLVFAMQAAQGGTSPQHNTAAASHAFGYYTQVGQGALLHASDDNNADTLTWTAFSDQFFSGRCAISDNTVRKIKGLGLYDGEFLIEKQDTTGIAEVMGLLFLRGANPRVGVFSARTDTTPFNLSPSGIGTIHGAMFLSGNRNRTGTVADGDEDGGVGAWSKHPSLGDQQMYRGIESTNALGTSDTVRIGLGYAPGADNHGIYSRVLPGTGTEDARAVVTAYPGPTLEITFTDPEATTNFEVLYVLWGQSTPPLQSVTRQSERLKGQLTFVTATTQVAGKLRTSQRLTGALQTTVAVAGTLRTSQRLTGAVQTTVAVAGQVRTSERLTGAVITTVDVAGTLRHAQRLTGALTFVSSNQQVAGTLRTSQRLTGALITTVDIAGTVRTNERLTGQLGTKQAVAGTLRHSQRLTGAVVTTSELVGTVRTGQRLTGLVVTTVALQGTTRTSERLLGAVITTVDITGTTRHAQRLTGALTTTVDVAGTSRHSQRLTGDLTMMSSNQPIAGRLRTSQRLYGALITTVDIAGIARHVQRLTGAVDTTVAVAGIVRTIERLKGQLKTTVAVAGKLRHTQRLVGFVQTTLGSFKNVTVNAVLKKSLTKSVTVNAHLILQQTKAVTVNAILKKALTKTVAVDAVLKKSLTKAVTTDAVLKKSLTKTVTADAVLQKAQTKTVVANAVLLKSLTKSTTVNAVLQKQGTKTVTVNAILKKALTKVVTVNAVLKKSLTKTVAVDAVLVALVPGQLTVFADAVLQKAFTKSVTVNAHLILQQVKTVTVNAVLQKAQTKTVVVDAVLQKALTKTVTTNAVLQKQLVKTVTTNAVLQKPLTKTVAVDAVLQKQGVLHTVAVDAHIVRHTDLAVTVDAFLLKQVTKTVTVDAMLLGGVGSIHVLAVELYGPGIGVGLYGPLHTVELYSVTSTEELA